MNDSNLGTLTQVRAFLALTKQIAFVGVSRDEKYGWVNDVLQRFRYFTLTKRDRSVVKEYIQRLTGFSDAQTTRLIRKKKRFGVIGVTRRKPRSSFAHVYTPGDVALLMDVDCAHGRLSGPATTQLFQRAYRVFGDKRFERMADISVSHLYNLRGTRQYVSRLGDTFVNTKAVRSAIGELTNSSAGNQCHGSR